MRADAVDVHFDSAHLFLDLSDEDMDVTALLLSLPESMRH